jgi:hypothetical protein
MQRFIANMNEEKGIWTAMDAHAKQQATEEAQEQKNERSKLVETHFTIPRYVFEETGPTEEMIFTDTEQNITYELVAGSNIIKSTPDTNSMILSLQKSNQAVVRLKLISKDRKRKRSDHWYADESIYGTTVPYFNQYMYLSINKAPKIMWDLVRSRYVSFRVLHVTTNEIGAVKYVEGCLFV